MSLIAVIVIAIVILAVLAQQIFLNRKDSKEYEKIILNLPTQWGGWIELADAGFHPLMFGKVLYSFDWKVVGVGVLMNEYLPAALVSDIAVKISPQLLDGRLPLCRFIIDCHRGVIFTELKDMQMREKLKPYVDEYSKIKLMIGFDSNEFILIDNKEGESNFERIWQETREAGSEEKK
jgi:hypothetical protein